jgi:phenylalanyl-tRNA synthetase beta chain
MTISYNWLLDYLPIRVEPERLNRILNSIGLEVEGMEHYEEVKGGLLGLVVGEVLLVEKHPNADKLSLTRVDTGGDAPLDIVCGAPNVAAGQKVVVAPVGATIYPSKGDPLTMRVAKIRGSESHGMICAEDEIGLGDSHAGIMILPGDLKVGTPAADYFKPYSDTVFEIGLTPNRSDAMSHLGVARDVCAYLNHHDRKDYAVKLPYAHHFKPDNMDMPFTVDLANPEACPRYAGVTITGVKPGPSPLWMQQRLKAIGSRPINNIVDITNYILHETGQPLHAFDADQVKGCKIIVSKRAAGTPFVSLDGKERKLDGGDLMICNGDGEGMCIAGVFGGLHSGVSGNTTNVFLESAWFSPAGIRRTSFRHNLRTDAAARFEKGVDIGSTVEVLKRAALMIREICGGTIASDIIDMYPAPRVKTQVTVKYHYLKKVSGKNYHPDTVKRILEALGFTIEKETIDAFTVAVPLHKTDVSLPADIAEEIMRIDGFDNIDIPSAILIAPAVESMGQKFALQEKVSTALAGQGFQEILNNSITNSAFYSEQESASLVRMMNNLSAELNVLRPSMLETGLGSVSYNLNRRNQDLQFFEFGKTYATVGDGQYAESEHLALFATGNRGVASWRGKPGSADLFFLKGVVESLLQYAGISGTTLDPVEDPKLHPCLEGSMNGQALFRLGMVRRALLDRFDIRQDLAYADLFWDAWVEGTAARSIRFREIPRFPAVTRDLAFVVDRSLPYAGIEKAALNLKLEKLKKVSLFDVFENERIGAGKRSMAMSFVFQDEEKTLTDAEIDKMMQKIIFTFEKDLQAQIRR